MTVRTCLGTAILAVLAGVGGCASNPPVMPGVRSELPMAVLRAVPPLELPGVTIPEKNRTGLIDGSSPLHWDGDTLYVFSSIGWADRSTGADLFKIEKPSVRTHFDNEADRTIGARWIQATYKDDSGLLYAWYQNETLGACSPDKRLTVPRIGAAVSADNGLHWKDLGIVLTVPPDSLNCETANHYLAGGNGDLSVILDQQKRCFYFLFSSYHREVAEQGVAIARMAFADRDRPVGKVFKWSKDAWDEPGLGGHVTPIFPAAVDWHQAKVDAFWGPSIHYNTHLDQYVIVMNRAKDKQLAQEGVYVTFCRDAADPKGWTTPVKVFDGRGLRPGRSIGGTRR